MTDSALLELLQGGALKPWGLSQRRLKPILKQTDFFRSADGSFRHGRVRCDRVLELCRPVMDALAPEPEGGWLKEIYLELCHRLYPDPGRGTMGAGPRRAMGFYLTVLEYFLAREREHCAYDPLTDIPALTDEERAESLIGTEYARYETAIAEAHFVSLMRLGREIMPFDPASHTIGVHHMALHMARQCRKAGLPVDICLVSAASLSHDIGKFGCRGKDLKRIPYLHYYYTYQWLKQQDLPKIAHIAANHSTWDLEFENLTLESLLLIYADFRVRGLREDGREKVRIYTLEQSYEMIFSKLFDMTAEKQRRYKTVYTKLSDFERWLVSLGVSTDPLREGACRPAEDHPALASHSQTLEELVRLTFRRNILLMHTITKDVVFAQLLEQTRSEKSLHRIRADLDLIEEYSTYMTSQNKRRTLGLLYELLMHRQGDVRRQSARIMGQILANSGPRYRKELPTSAPRSAEPPATAAYLHESVELWTRYMDMCLTPDHKISAKHAQRISNSLKIIAKSLFAACDELQLAHYLAPLLQRLDRAEGPARFALADALYFLPLDRLEDGALGQIVRVLCQMLASDEPDQVLALRRLELLAPRLPDPHALLPALAALAPGSDAVLYLKNRLLLALGAAPETAQPDFAAMHLSNLKSTVHWIVKITQIEALLDEARRRSEEAFHTAMHFANLLSVSEHLPVREKAGEALVGLFPLLRLEERNEIIVDLLRELETGQDEISVYIPAYLGRLLAFLPDKELTECLDFLENLVRTGTLRAAASALRTLGTTLVHLEGSGACAKRCMGLLLAGVSHYDDNIHAAALQVLCAQVIAGPAPIERRLGWAGRAGKKLLNLLLEPRERRETSFLQAAALNQLYRFLVRVRVDELPLARPENRPVAFFPGTFDPFTAGHKGIVRELTAQGFAVYLAIDEFSWSKQPIPRLTRRRIASMSTADQENVYLFPDELPVNIAYPQELAALKARFPGRELYLVTGSDVVLNASAYRTNAPGSAGEYNHIVFLREKEDLPRVEQTLRGKRLILSLPAFYETVSSTRLREYVDQDMDISMLVDPMVQSYIFANNLYLHAPQYKKALPPQARRLRFTPGETCEAALVTDDGAVLGLMRAKTIRGRDLYPLLRDEAAVEYLRQKSSGKLLWLLPPEHGSAEDGDGLRVLCNELLVRSLTGDHSYALCDDPTPALRALLPQFGFVPVEGRQTLWWVDMRAPMVLVQDVCKRFKEPYASDEEVLSAVFAARPRLRQAIAGLFPGRLLLSFDTELLDQCLLARVRQVNPPAPGERLGEAMCVPYGKLLSGEIVPGTVTKSLHTDKVYGEDIYHFSIRALPGYGTLDNQIRTIRAFHRPVLLVDDLLHKGYRLQKLGQYVRQEDLELRQVLVGILSDRGRDLMDRSGIPVWGEYLVPNLSYWFTESLLYPYVGGDSMDSGRPVDGLLPSANLILPFFYPDYLHGVTEESVLDFSLCALQNARDILLALERSHQRRSGSALSLRRLPEVMVLARVPDRGRYHRYEGSSLPSVLIREDIETFRRIRRSHP